MQKKKLLGFLFFFLLTNNLYVLADEGHNHGESIKNATEKFRNGNAGDQVDDSNHEPAHHVEGHSVQGNTGYEEDHVIGQHESGNHGHENGGHEEGNSNHDDGDHEDTCSTDEADGHQHDDRPPIEPGPDYKVLGGFGAVNLTFMIIGIRNKWIRRKGERHGAA